MPRWSDGSSKVAAFPTILAAQEYDPVLEVPASPSRIRKRDGGRKASGLRGAE